MLRFFHQFVATFPNYLELSHMNFWLRSSLIEIDSENLRNQYQQVMMNLSSLHSKLCNEKNPLEYM